MTTREFIMHLILNCGSLDDPVQVEVFIPENMNNRYVCFEPAHVTTIGSVDDSPETLIECKPWKENS